MDKDKILQRWNTFIKAESKKLQPYVPERREKIKKKVSLSIWLGGPGRTNCLYALRELIKSILIQDHFQVFLSEDYTGGPDLASRELEQVRSVDMIILLAISVGSSAEAIDFANKEDLLKKLCIYFPEEYKNGYIYKALNGRYNLLPEENILSLDVFKKYDPYLPYIIHEKAINFRELKAMNMAREHKTERRKEDYVF